MSAASGIWSPYLERMGHLSALEAPFRLVLPLLSRMINREVIDNSFGEPNSVSVRYRRYKDGRNHARGMTILIRGGRAGSGRRDGLMMVRRISSFDLVPYLAILPAQDGEHGIKICGGLALIIGSYLQAIQYSHALYTLLVRHRTLISLGHRYPGMSFSRSKKPSTPSLCYTHIQQRFMICIPSPSCSH